MINGELIVDNFAGGGGASTGIELATGISVDIAINHDPEAIKMHKMNHPSAKHYCESVWDVDPVKACKGNPVALAWFSPDCKHFSKAKGGKPEDKNIRGLAWVALRWAAKVRPRVIMLENVEEFRTWGPLNRRHRPIKSKQGETFKKFVKQLENLGYVVEFNELIAADYGAPTTRKRFFMIARCDNKPIIWPKPTHAPAKSEEVKAGLLKPYVGAYTQLDFSLPCPSIFDTSEEIKEKYGIRAVRPLAPKTMERIARGLKKFVIDNAEPFVVQVNHSGAKSDYCKSMNEPLNTITGKHGFGLVEPYLVQIGQTGFSSDRSKDVREPLTTIVSKNEHCLIETKVAPIIDKAYVGNYGSSVENPLNTITTVDHNRLVEVNLQTLDEKTRLLTEQKGADVIIDKNRYPAWCEPKEMNKLPFTDPELEMEIQKQINTPFMGTNTTNHPGGRADEPLHTITTGNQQCLISPLLIQYHSESSEKGIRGQAIDEPIMTVDSSNRYGLVEGFLSKYYKKTSPKELCVKQGLPKEVAKDDISRFIKYPLYPHPIEQELSSPNPENYDTSASCLIQMNHYCYGRDIAEPIPTITAGDGHFGEVRAFLIKYYGQGTGQDIKEPLDTITAQDRFGLVTIAGVDYQIVDIGLRMLEPRELYGCQGFPDDYIIDRDFEGKKYPRNEQVRRCGNAVCPPIPAALVSANLPELCISARMPNMRIDEDVTGQLKFA